MKTKRFTFLQLIAVVEDTISTNDADLQTILSHLVGHPVSTIEIPHALNVVRLANPMWYSEIRFNLYLLKLHHYKWYRSRKGNFKRLLEVIKEEEMENISFDIPPLQ